MEDWLMVRLRQLEKLCSEKLHSEETGIMLCPAYSGTLDELFIDDVRKPSQKGNSCTENEDPTFAESRLSRTTSMIAWILHMSFDAFPSAIHQVFPERAFDNKDRHGSRLYDQNHYLAVNLWDRIMSSESPDLLDIARIQATNASKRVRQRADTERPPFERVNFAFEIPRMSKTLPIAFLPFHVVSQSAGPPEYDDGLDSVDASLFEEDSVCKVFVSHRWLNPGEPNVKGDWQRLQETFDGLIRDAMTACIVLDSLDFPFSALHYEAFRSFEMQPLVNNTMVRLIDESRFPSLSKYDFKDVSGHVKSKMVHDVLRIVLHYRMLVGTIPEQRHYHDWYQSAAQRIWIWYDFTSLPQRPKRRADQERLFSDTLDHLHLVQGSMNTLSINTDSNYYQRAWCAAEILNASRHGRSSVVAEDASELSAIQLPSGLPVLAVVFIALLDGGTFPYEEVLEVLNLKFTDSKHETQTPTICWILWNAAFVDVKDLSQDLWNKRRLTNTWEAANPLAAGTIEALIEWFNLVYWSCVTAGHWMTYDRQMWHERREKLVSLSLPGTVSLLICIPRLSTFGNSAYLKDMFETSIAALGCLKQDFEATQIIRVCEIKKRDDWEDLERPVFNESGTTIIWPLHYKGENA